MHVILLEVNVARAKKLVVAVKLVVLREDVRSMWPRTCMARQNGAQQRIDPPPEASMYSNVLVASIVKRL